MTFFQNSVLSKFVFQQTVSFSHIKWIHNDFVYVRFGGMRKTKTWSKSN